MPQSRQRPARRFSSGLVRAGGLFVRVGVLAGEVSVKEPEGEGEEGAEEGGSRGVVFSEVADGGKGESDGERAQRRCDRETAERERA